MKTSKLLALFVLLTLSSCATPSTIMVNPNSQEWRNCATMGWGLMGLATAVMAHDSCVSSLRDIGYVTIDEYKGGSR